MVIKASHVLRGVTQLLAITRNYKPQAPGRGGCGVRPPPTLQLEMRPEPEAWAGQLEAGVPAHRLPALGNTAVSAEMCRMPQRVRPLRGKEWVTLTSSFLLWSAPTPPAWAGGQRLPCAQPWPSPCRGPARSAYLPARGPAGPGPVSGALPLPVIPGPALGRPPPLPSSAVTCPQLLRARGRLCLVGSSL